MKDVKINDRVFIREPFDTVSNAIKKGVKGTIIGIFDEPIVSEDYPELDIVSKGDYQVQIDNVHKGAEFIPLAREEIILIES